MPQERGDLEMVMIEVPVRSRALLAAILGIVLGATSFASRSCIKARRSVPGSSQGAWMKEGAVTSMRRRGP